MLVADDDGSVVGMCEATGNVWVEGKHMANIGFSVIKPYRKKGVGSMLMKEMLKLCRKRYEIITAGYFASNSASKALLKKFGFKKFAYGPRFVKRGKLYLDDEMVYLKLK